MGHTRAGIRGGGNMEHPYCKFLGVRITRPRGRAGGYGMNVSDVINTIGVVVALGFSVWAAFKGQRHKDKKEDIELSADQAQAQREEDDRVSAQWRSYAKSREQIHKADIDRVEARILCLEKDTLELREAERACFARATALETENTILRGQVRELRSALGMQVSDSPSGPHKPIEGQS